MLNVVSNPEAIVIMGQDDSSLNVAVGSAGWRSLDAGAIVRGASSNAISAVCSVSDLTTCRIAHPIRSIPTE